MKTNLWRRLSAFVGGAFLSLSGAATAQVSGPFTPAVPVPVPVPVPASPVPVTSVGGPPFVEAWVDPCNGIDTTNPFAQINCQDSPFQTLNYAISTLASSGMVGPSTPGLVHADPGVYSRATNGEILPVIMRDYISVQGTGGRQCVIRGSGTPNRSVFVPGAQPSCTCGGFSFQEVLVDLNSLFEPVFEEMIDGFTFQGGYVQLYLYDAEVNCRFRVSNCVFDMLDYGPVRPGVSGPSFGVLMVHVWDPSGYKPDPLNILNNTFIQGWMPVTFHPVVARAGSVAICDVNDPLCSFPFPDPNPTLRGVGKPNIQNNLIRFAPGFPRTAMLGIDASDVTASVGTFPGPTNAFDPTLVGGVDLTNSFCSQIVGSPPRPRVNPNPLGVTPPPRGDPAFVGEMLTSLFGQPLFVSRDWRILPDSILVDQGSAPLGGVLQALNGSAYREPALVPLSSFDLDFEVYGNPRINGQQPDIGCDETTLMIDCAGWGNDSVNHTLNCTFGCAQFAGQPVRGLIFPTAGTFALFETRLPVPIPPPFVCPGGFYWAYTTMFGTIVPPVTLGGFVAPFNLLWMNAAFVTPGPSGSAAAVTYTAPFDPFVHSFGAGAAPANNGTVPCVYLNEQAIWVPAGSTASFLTNLQSSTD